MSTKQIPLDIVLKLPYSADGFVVHQGVRPIFDAIVQATNLSHFFSFFVQGSPESGKTHFSLYLSESMKHGQASLINACEFKDILETSIPPSQVIIVDDADRVFSDIHAGGSGGFVAFHEACRHAGKVLVYFSAKARTDFPCDEHVMSRLLTAQEMLIQGPEEELIPDLLEALASQRGIKLSDRKIAYLAKRLGPSLPSLIDHVDTIEQLSRESVSTKFEVLGKALSGSASS